MNQQEQHPLQPFLPQGGRLLMCGTFPPQKKRWSMDFYYPNYINDMWRIFGLIYFGDKDHFVDAARKTFRLDELKPFLEHVGIGLSDTGQKVTRLMGNAADKHLMIEQPIDLAGTLSRMPGCRDVATTGEKAASVIAAMTGTEIPPRGDFRECTLPGDSGLIIRHWRMPSSSRAYPLPLEQKADFYRRMLLHIGLLPSDL